MARAFRIKTNAREVSFRFGKISDEVNLQVKRQIFESALKIESEAKKRAPVDTGALRSSITHDIRNNGFTALVGTNKKYAPFREFGTGKQTKVPAGFASVASQFKGSGGFPPVRDIRGWARRHGFEGLEFVLARSIFREGTKPQPFLIPSFLKEKPKFEKEIIRILRKGGRR